MTWVLTASAVVGALLAQRFRIIALLPATLAVAVVAFAVAKTLVSSPSSTVLMIVVTSASMQAGYFVGLLVRRAVRRASRLTSFSKPHRPGMPCTNGRFHESDTGGSGR